jgi:hypothetical protein
LGFAAAEKREEEAQEIMTVPHTVYIGWECDSIQNGSGQFIFQLPANAVLIGYQLDLSMVQLTKPPLIGGAPFSQVLFQAGWSTAVTQPSGWALGGNPLPYWDVQHLSGSLDIGIHGGSPVLDGLFCAAILKEWVPNAVNKSIVNMGLNIALKAGNWIAMTATHSGLQVDFECQGILFFQT